MRNWTEINERLSEDLDRSIVQTRVQGNTTIPYLTGESVIRLLNDVFEPDGWSSDIQEPQRIPLVANQVLYYTKATIILYGYDNNGRVAEVIKTDLGKNLVNLTDTEDRTFVIGQNNEMSAAGAVTDGLKRCARQLGNVFGLSLYDKSSEDFKAVTKKTQTKRKSTRKTTSKKTTTKKPANKPTGNESELERALNYTLPVSLVGEDIPLGGNTLREIVKHDIAPSLLSWLGGESESPLGKAPWKPEDDENKKTSAACKYVYEHLDEARKLALSGK
jgi:hypothetical protein